MASEKERVALGSIAASAGLTLAKGVVGLMTGSLAILSEAGHSLIDLGATVITYFAVRVSGKPADAEHHYGHGKVESVAALAETALLFLLSGVVIWEALQRLFGGHGHAVEATLWAFAVMVGLDRGRLLPRTRCSTGSPARHRARRSKRTPCISAPTCGHRSRSWSDLPASRSACMGRFGRRARGGGVHLRRRLAARPAHHRHAHRHRAGRRRRQDRARRRARARRGRRRAACGCGRSGDMLFVELAVAVSRTLPLERVAVLKDRIVDAVRADICRRPRSTVITEPRALDDESVLERVMVIARNRGARRAPRHRACDRRAALGLARSRSRRDAAARRRARDRERPRSGA